MKQMQRSPDASNLPWPAAPLSAGAGRSYSLSEAAARLGVSRVTLWRWVRAGRIPVARLGARTTRIRSEDVERLLAPVGPDTARPWVGVQHGAGVPCADWTDMRTADHFVQFYEADDVLLDAVGQFLGAALRAGEVGIAIATRAHRAALDERLCAAGLDVGGARMSQRYVTVDAAETLARIMVDGMPDPARFADVVGSLIAQAAAGGRRVRAFGEMVALLAAEGKHDAVIGLEDLWNELQTQCAFTLFCAYPIAGLGGVARAALLDDVCASHARVIPAESYTTLATSDERLRAIATLQQKAQSLEAALAAERAARAAAETALRVRDEFLSVAAHELRTPLTTLVGRTQLALRLTARQAEPLPAPVGQALQGIIGQVGKLTRLLNHLLDVSRLEGGKLALERQPTDLAALLRQVATDAGAWSDRHPISVSGPLSLEAFVDPLRLEQVLTNLLENALKYSPDGGPIEVVLVAADEAAELSVRDRGLGIPPEQRGAIFERFSQAHAGGHRSGLGLGLYICRQIVELHGGEIWSEFPADGGTRFTVRLPLTTDERPLPGAAPQARPGGLAGPPRREESR